MNVTVYESEFPSEKEAYRDGRPFTWLDTRNTVWPVGWSEVTLLDKPCVTWLALDAGKVARYVCGQVGGWNPLNDEIADAFAEDFPGLCRFSAYREARN